MFIKSLLFFVLVKIQILKLFVCLPNEYNSRNVLIYIMHCRFQKKKVSPRYFLLHNPIILSPSKLHTGIYVKIQKIAYTKVHFTDMHWKIILFGGISKYLSIFLDIIIRNIWIVIYFPFRQNKKRWKYCAEMYNSLIMSILLSVISPYIFF